MVGRYWGKSRSNSLGLWACRTIRTGVRIRFFYPTRAVSTAQARSLFPRQWPSVPSGPYLRQAWIHAK